MHVLCPLLAATFCILACGCATYTQSSRQMRNDWYAGNFSGAAAQSSEMCADAIGSDDEVLSLLEYGAVLRANARLAESAEVFDRAEILVHKYDEPGDETAAILVNQTLLPYTGYNYDRIMLGAYQALNYIELKRFEKAEIWLKKLENFQSDAEAKNRKRIDSQMKAIEKAQIENGKKNYDISKSLSNSIARNAFEKYYGADYLLPNAKVQAGGVYTNPFAYWLAGLYFSNRPADASDKSRAADFFRLANQSCPQGNSVAASDAAAAEALANGTAQNMGNYTYLIFEAGSAPIRQQFKIDIPLYVFAQTLPHVSMNFPFVQPIKSDIQLPSFSGGGQSAQAKKIADIDEIVNREFKNELPVVIMKTMLTSAVKAGAQFGAQYAVRDNTTAVLIVAIAGSIYQVATNDADLRTWTTLPKAIYIAKLPTPKNGVVEVDGRKVSVDTTGVNVIVAKKTSHAANLLIRQFNFKKQ